MSFYFCYKLFEQKYILLYNLYANIIKGDNHNYPVKEFLDAKIWNNKSFWQVENEMEWVDA